MLTLRQADTRGALVCVVSRGTELSSPLQDNKDDPQSHISSEITRLFGNHTR